jgi:hypothetical protein
MHDKNRPLTKAELDHIQTAGEEKKDCCEYGHPDHYPLWKEIVWWLVIVGALVLATYGIWKIIGGH